MSLKSLSVKLYLGVAVLAGVLWVAGVSGQTIMSLALVGLMLAMHAGGHGGHGGHGSRDAQSAETGRTGHVGHDNRAGLADAVQDLITRLTILGAVMKLPPQGIDATIAEGLTPLLARGIVLDTLQTAPDGQGTLDFYAGPVLQRLALFPTDAATQQTQNYKM